MWWKTYTIQVQKWKIMLSVYRFAIINNCTITQKKKKTTNYSEYIIYNIVCASVKKFNTFSL